MVPAVHYYHLEGITKRIVNCLAKPAVIAIDCFDMRDPIRIAQKVKNYVLITLLTIPAIPLLCLAYIIYRCARRKINPQIHAQRFAKWDNVVLQSGAFRNEFINKMISAKIAPPENVKIFIGGNVSTRALCSYSAAGNGILLYENERKNVFNAINQKEKVIICIWIREPNLIRSFDNWTKDFSGARDLNTLFRAGLAKPGEVDSDLLRRNLEVVVCKGERVHDPIRNKLARLRH